MLARGLGARLELLLLPPVLVDSHSLALVHTFSRVPWGTTGRQGGVKNGSLIVFKIESSTGPNAPLLIPPAWVTLAAPKPNVALGRWSDEDYARFCRQHHVVPGPRDPCHGRWRDHDDRDCEKPIDVVPERSAAVRVAAGNRHLDVQLGVPLHGPARRNDVQRHGNPGRHVRVCTDRSEPAQREWALFGLVRRPRCGDLRAHGTD